MFPLVSKQLRCLAVAAMAAAMPATAFAQNAQSDHAPSENVISSSVSQPVLQPEVGAFSSGGSIPCEAIGRDDLLTSPADDCATRKTLFGDPLGLRAGLDETGVSVLQFDLTQVYQGVASGGREQVSRYGGHSDLVIRTDFGKMGGPKGLFLQVRGEGNYGESIGSEAGILLPPALQTQLPVSNERNYAVTNFLFTQMFSETFGVFFGKSDTLDSDKNAFASGRGKTQFLNAAFVFNSAVAQPIPYSTLMAGFAIVTPDQEPILFFSVMNPTDTTTTIGLDDVYSDGAIVASVLRLPTKFFGRPGHQLIGGLWSSRDVVALDQDPRVLLPALGLPGASIQQTGGSWAVFYNMDQYLFVDPANKERGWGFFARYGAADPETNLVSHFASGGFGGSSLLPTRKADTWGVGYYHTWISDSFVTKVARLQNAQGIEAYYRAMVTPYFDVTPDIQFLDGSLHADEDWATILGVRANLRF